MSSRAPRVLHVMDGMPSYYHSALEFGARLARDDIEVVFACHRDVAALVEARGFRFRRLAADERRFAERVRLSRHWSSGPRRLVAKARRVLAERRDSLASRELVELVEAERPDALAIDIECHHAIVVTRRFDIPTVLLSPWCGTFRQRGVPPQHSSLPLPRSGGERLRVELRWAALHASRALHRLRDACSPRARLAPVGYRATSPTALRALARAHGQRPAALFDPWHWLAPHVYRGLPVLSLVAAELDFPVAVDPRQHPVGPMVSATGTTFAEADDERARLDAFLDETRRAGRRLVYASLGTYRRSNVAFLERVISVFRTRPDLALVVGLGGRSDSDAFAALPDNVRVLGVAPQVRLLARCDLAILHAGIGSLNEAFSFARPALVFSAGHVDQNGTAARVEHHRLGRVMSIARDGTREIERAIDECLADRTLPARLAAFAAACERYDRDNAVARVVRTLCLEGAPRGEARQASTQSSDRIAGVPGTSLPMPIRNRSL